MSGETFEKEKKPDERALVTALFARRLAHPLVVAADALGLSANAVTVLGGLCWMVSLPLAVFAGRAGSLPLWFACGALWNAGYLLDVADGSLARLHGASSRAGFYLDYVFHLLFKPAFLASVGIALALANGGSPALLVLAALSVPANWSASSSAAEHVLCEEIGRGRLGVSGTPRFLWFGLTDIADSAADKAASPWRRAKTLAAETVSYYLQAPFFSFAVLADILLGGSAALPGGACGRAVSAFLGAGGSVAMPCTLFCFCALSAVFIARIPFRVARDYRRFTDFDRIQRR